VTTSPRPARPQIVLSVVRTEWLTPRMVRVVAGGPGFADLAGNATAPISSTDKYTKIIFAKPRLGLLPPYNLEALRESLPQDDWPVTRTYTIRWIDELARQVAIDFVVHGTEGVAGPWAASAVAGDPLVLGGVGGAYAPDAGTGWHVLAGDESALPAISSALESMSPDARGVAHLEVEDDSDVQLLQKPEGVRIDWILRGHDRVTTTLAEAVDASLDPGTLPADATMQVFAHGERESMKAVRAVLARRGVTRDRFSLSGYWAHGRTEDRFQAEKREPIGQIEA
jgi:NADPH-dependent ferric siderophore reductase